MNAAGFFESLLYSVRYANFGLSFLQALKPMREREELIRC